MAGGQNPPRRVFEAVEWRALWSDMRHGREKPAVAHHMAQIDANLRLHCVTAGEGRRTALLLHGFPQTWWEWRRVIPPLVESGFRVVAPDYRGAGHSSRPSSGYDKGTMASDIHHLLHDHLGITEPLSSWDTTSV